MYFGILITFSGKLSARRLHDLRVFLIASKNGLLPVLLSRIQTESNFNRINFDEREEVQRFNMHLVVFIADRKCLVWWGVTEKRNLNITCWNFLREGAYFRLHRGWFNFSLKLFILFTHIILLPCHEVSQFFLASIFINMVVNYVCTRYRTDKCYVPIRLPPFITQILNVFLRHFRWYRSEVSWNGYHIYATMQLNLNLIG